MANWYLIYYYYNMNCGNLKLAALILKLRPYYSLHAGSRYLQKT